MKISYYKEWKEDVAKDKTMLGYDDWLKRHFCPKCEKPWLDHEFAVPAPYCP